MQTIVINPSIAVVGMILGSMDKDGKCLYR